MNRRTVAAAAGILLALSLTACAGAPMSESSSSRPPFQTTTPGPVESAGIPSGTPTDVSEPRWAAIKTDLSVRGVSGEPTLVSSEAVTWPNGALGCATPGQNYTQALVDGMRVIVEVDGTSYDFRFGTGDEPKLCEGYTPGALRQGSVGDGSL